MGHDTIFILDFGSQYTQLIARRVREEHVYCEIVPYNISSELVKERNVKGLIFSGGPASVYSEQSPLPRKDLLSLGIPVLGICYGMQAIAILLNSQVIPAKKREYGPALLYVDNFSDLFLGLPDSFKVWMSHSDAIAELPSGFQVLAHTDNSPYAAIADLSRRIYGLQFHPEVVHTEYGSQILANFLFNVCKCHPTWTMRSFIEESVESIKEKVGNRKVICALSGGVDSSVTAALVHRAIGDNLVCIFINNGLLRKNEPERVQEIFGRAMKMNLRYVDASERFLKALEGVTDPEEKRKIIGHKFIRVFEEEAGRVEGAEFLAQGTLYPDVIESVSPFGGPSARIKSHHNVGGLPEDMKLKLIEPLRELFKDEVRKLGKELGLPDEIIFRQPFPGPGLAVRCLGEITKEKLDILREADWIVVDEIKRASLYTKIWQSFAVLLPLRTVGVMGDERTYEYVIALRAVHSVDGMTADWVRLPYDLLGRISNRIINEVKGVNRVVYDISSKPPATIEWE